jgi:hypothetical protein
MCAYSQILKVVMLILYKKNIIITFLLEFEKYKNQLMGIITSFLLSIRI